MTSRTLVIIRHAKAEQIATGADFNRPLTTRGRNDAAAAGAWLVAEGIAPDVIVCSPTVRTRSTWHALAIALAEGPPTPAPKVRYEQSLYDNGLSAALDLIQSVDPDAGTVLLIGHNPTVSALSVRLDDRSIRPAGGLRTAGIAVHDVTVPWAQCVAARLTKTHTSRG
jgi:phosphohistidine phosphatase